MGVVGRQKSAELATHRLPTEAASEAVGGQKSIQLGEPACRLPKTTQGEYENTGHKPTLRSRGTSRELDGPPTGPAGWDHDQPRTKLAVAAA